MRNQDYRRHQRQKAIAKAERLIRNRGWGGDAKKLASSGTPCSCFMCGNPRKWFNEPTMQEKKHNIDE